MVSKPPTVLWSGLVRPDSTGSERQAAAVVAISGRHDRPIPVHAHDFWELQVCASGSARHETQDGAGDFTRGSVVLMRPGTWHRKDRCHGLVSWACCWPVTAMAEVLAPSLKDPRLVPLLRHPGAALVIQLPESVLRRCLVHLKSIPQAPSFVQQARLLLLLDEIARHLSSPVAKAIPPAVLRALDAVDAAPAHAWTVTGLARQAQLSVAHFARCCRQLSDLSPQAYIIQRRLERAMTLLLNGEQSVSSIALICGFSEPSYFARCFRRHYGSSPSAWIGTAAAEGVG